MSSAPSPKSLPSDRPTSSGTTDRSPPPLAVGEVGSSSSSLAPSSSPTFQLGSVPKPADLTHRPLAPADTRPVLGNNRRVSVQFASSIPTTAGQSLQYQQQQHGEARRVSSVPYRPLRRISSPPPPPTFQNRVSFDTFDSKDTPEFSLTLNTKHKDFQYTRRSRIFLCGLNKDEYSEYALEWLIDELVDDGDEIVCLRVVDKESKIASDASIRDGKYAREARKMLDWVIDKNTEEKAISLVLEFAVGRTTELIQRMINTYEPAILIVGTKGKSLGGIQGLLPGSISKYCLQNSPVPVIVVRPSEKREKKKSKRQRRPDRGSYLDILERSGTRGSHVLDRENRGSIVPEIPAASENEAQAVAAAIGISSGYESKTEARLSRTANRSDTLSEDGEDPKSPGILMKSPTLGDLESPVPSDSEDESGNELEAIPGSMLATHDVASDDEEDKAVGASTEVQTDKASGAS